jgi:hypothetical protein
MPRISIGAPSSCTSVRPPGRIAATSVRSRSQVLISAACAASAALT